MAFVDRAAKYLFPLARSAIRRLMCNHDAILPGPGTSTIGGAVEWVKSEPAAARSIP